MKGERRNRKEQIVPPATPQPAPDLRHDWRAPVPDEEIVARLNELVEAE